jgi:hypothetical protein
MDLAKCSEFALFDHGRCGRRWIFGILMVALILLAISTLAPSWELPPPIIGTWMSRKRWKIKFRNSCAHLESKSMGRAVSDLIELWNSIWPSPQFSHTYFLPRMCAGRHILSTYCMYPAFHVGAGWVRVSLINDGEGWHRTSWRIL